MNRREVINKPDGPQYCTFCNVLLKDSDINKKETRRNCHRCKRLYDNIRYLTKVPDEDRQKKKTRAKELIRHVDLINSGYSIPEIVRIELRTVYREELMNG